MWELAYARPSALAETFDLLDEYGESATLLAGGTDVGVGLGHGVLKPRILVDIKRMTDLRPGIHERGGWVSITATTPMTDIIGDERIQRHYPALVEAAATVGSVQIRNRASLAGNVCNASPAADTEPALLVYDAVVVTAGREGERRLPLDQFVLGPRRTALRRGEMVVSVDLPVPESPLGATSLRLTRRRGVDLAIISVCCAAGVDHVRFGYGAVGPRPFLVRDDDGILARRETDPESRERLLRQFVAQATPISDVRASQDYRQAMLLVLTRRALDIALARRDGAAIR